MKVIDHLSRAKEPLLSFEIVPPKRGSDFQKLEQVISDLAQFSPPFIDVTSHAAEDDNKFGKSRRKRPGTLGICAVIQHKYKIDAVPHVLCHGFTREETEDFLVELNYLGIRNVLALRGDKTNHQKPILDGRSKNEYAVDLVKQIADMNKGKYLEDQPEAVPSDFCTGVAGYPETHFEAPHATADLRHLLEKVDAGAEYIVTQMFFDNKHYFNFVKRCQDQGITVPIIPGLKVLTSKEQLTTLPEKFYLNLPSELTQQVQQAQNKEEVTEVGIRWALKQAEELCNHNVPAVHFYVMGNSAPVTEVIKRLRRKIVEI